MSGIPTEPRRSCVFCGALASDDVAICDGCQTLPLVSGVVAMGREVHVTTYYDGPSSPQKARLMFHHPDDAKLCADLLRQARRPRRS